MRLGKKKEKDRDGEKEQCIDGVARLICSPKSHLVPLRGRRTIINFLIHRFDHSFMLLHSLFAQCILTEPNGLA
jgi:hypothetical protein